MAIIIEYTQAAEAQLKNGADISDMYAHMLINYGGDAMKSHIHAGIIDMEWLYDMDDERDMHETLEDLADYISDKYAATGRITVAADADDLLEYELMYVDDEDPVTTAVATILRDACGYDLADVIVGYSDDPRPSVIWTTAEALGKDADEYDARALHIRAYQSGKGLGWYSNHTNLGWLYEYLDCAPLAAELRQEAEEE
jgi:hypothetical protein